MNNQDGAAYIAYGVDTSDYVAKMRQMTDENAKFAQNADKDFSRVGELLKNVTRTKLAIPTDTKNLDLVKKGLEEASAVVDENLKAIRELEVHYGKLQTAREKLASSGQKGTSKDNALAKEADAVQQVIKAREKAIEEAGKQGDRLMKIEARLTAQDSIRTRIRDMKMELVEMEAAGQRGTAAYQEIQAKLAKLTDQWGDAQKQASILANDQRGFAGVMSGLTGLSGAFTAATGAAALFGGENEDLQKIMMKLQAVMSITMGLQQVQQTLNKDSAFSLVTLNGLKEWWNKLLAVGATEQAVETAATETATVAETENAGATTLSAAAKEAKSIASKQSATDTALDTAAQGANTVAATAGTAANISLAGAFRMVGAAIKSIPVFGWIAAAIAALVGVVASLNKKSKEVSEEIKKNNELLKESRKAYADAAIGIKEYQTRIRDFNGTQEEEKRLVAELNDKYGEQMGYCKTLDGWKTQLIKKGSAYCEMLMTEAKAQAVLAKASEAYVKYLEVEDLYRWKRASGTQSEANFQAEKNAALTKAELEYKEWERQFEIISEKSRNISRKYGLGNHTDPDKMSSTKSSGAGSYKGSGFDAKAAARTEKEALDNYEKLIEEHRKKMNDEINAANISNMKDGLKKELAQSKANQDALVEQWKAGMMNVALGRKQYLKEIYMAKQGATEEGWNNSADAKKTDDEYLQEFLDNPENEQMAKQYQERLKAIEAQGVAERLMIQQNYEDRLVEQYGTTEEKIKVLNRKFQEDVINDAIPMERYAEAEKQLDEQIRQLKEQSSQQMFDTFKASISWESIFGNLNNVASKSLQSFKEKIQDFLKSNKDLSPEVIKSINDAINKIGEKQDELSPFKALGADLSTLSDATKKVHEAQKEYNKTLKDGTQAEKDAAQATLESAQNAKQKALNDVTKSIKGAATQAKEILTVGNAITGCIEAFGVEVPEQISGFISGAGKVADALGSIDLTKPLSIISGIINAIGGMASAIGALFNNDAAKEKHIQKLAAQIEVLERSYDALGKEIEKAYSKDASQLIDQQNEILEQKRQLIELQKQEEEAKKNTDDDKIKSYNEQLQDLSDEIADNKEKAIDAIFGEDLQSAIENFADAWAQCENRTKSAKDTVRNMMKQMVQESIKAAIQASGAMEQIRNKLTEFYADNVLSDWEQQYVYNMAESLQKQLDEQFGWADSLLKDSNFQQDGSRGGFQAMPADMGSELNGRFTALQISGEKIANDTMTVSASMSTMREGMTEIQNIGLLQLAQLEVINKNTNELYEMNSTLEKIRRNTQNI